MTLAWIISGTATAIGLWLVWRWYDRSTTRLHEEHREKMAEMYADHDRKMADICRQQFRSSRAAHVSNPVSRKQDDA